MSPFQKTHGPRSTGRPNTPFGGTVTRQLSSWPTSKDQRAKHPLSKNWRTRQLSTMFKKKDGKNSRPSAGGSGRGGFLGGLIKKKNSKLEDDEVAPTIKNGKAGKAGKAAPEQAKARKSKQQTGKKRSDSGKPAPAPVHDAQEDEDDGTDRPAEIPEAFLNADPSKWKLRKYKFAGNVKADSMGREEVIDKASIAKGVKTFKANPQLYTAMLYQTNHLQRPESRQKYNLVHRKGTENYMPKGVSPDGWMTLIMYDYIRLPPYKNNDFPMEWRDPWTDNMVYRGQLLHSESNKPIMPGRGQGVGDTPNLKIIGDVDPSDIIQGTVSESTGLKRIIKPVCGKGACWTAAQAHTSTSYSSLSSCVGWRLLALVRNLCHCRI